MFNKYGLKTKYSSDKHNLWLCYFVDETIQKIEERDYSKHLSKNAIVNSAVILFSQLDFISEDCLKKELLKELKEEGALLDFGLDFVTDEEKNNASLKLYDKLIAGGINYFDNEAPQLFVELNHRCELFINAYDKMINRILLNSKRIAHEFFDTDDFDLIENIESGTPDLHNNGSYTTIITTKIGKFLYKPHNVENDKWFSELSKKYFSDIIHVPEIISIDHEYGFSKFIKNNPVSNINDVSKYYYNLGGLLAIIYMFGANDYHKENIIADGIYPVVVDFETILKTDKKTVNSNNVFNPYDEYNQSIVYAGMMPHYLFDKKMEYSPLLDKSDSNVSIPFVDGEKITVVDYENDFLKGFEDTYRKCLSIREDIKKYLNDTNDLYIRILPISTHYYCHILKYSYNKENMQSLETRKNETERFYLICNSDKRLYDFAKSEEDQILNGDIPYYYIKANEKNIYSLGETILSDYSLNTPVENTTKIMDKMSEDDLKIQLIIIRENIKFRNEPIDKKYNFTNIINNEISLDELNKEVLNIYNELNNSAITFMNGHTFWMNFGKKGNPNLCGFDLFDGFVGHALFYSLFSETTNDTELKNNVLHMCDICLNEADVLYGYYSSSNLLSNNVAYGLSGVGGMILGLSYIYKTQNNSKAKHLLDVLVNPLKEKDFTDVNLCDVYGGLSGLIIALYEYYEYSKSNELKDIIENAANRIISLRNLKYEDNMLWDTMDVQRPVSGWGHGIIGIVEALTIAYRVTKKEEYIQNAISAYKFEHNIYSEKLHTWPDLRELSFAENKMHGLCSGAPGIGLALLAIKDEKKYFETYDVDYNRAIQACKEYPLNYRDNLCCGNSAILHFLISDYMINNNEESLKKSLITLNNVITRKNNNNSYVFINDGFNIKNNNSLFFGTSGIGLEISRLLKILSK